MKGLTSRQVVVLRFIVEFREANGFSPSFREIAKALGIKSTKGVVDHLAFMAKKGVIDTTASTARSLVVTEAGLAALKKATEAA
jgi:repressor LexA